MVALKPDYKEATRYLHKAVAGVDVAEVQAQLESETRAHREARAVVQKETEARRQLELELQRRQAQLEAVSGQVSAPRWLVASLGIAAALIILVAGSWGLDRFYFRPLEVTRQAVALATAVHQTVVAQVATATSTPAPPPTNVPASTPAPLPPTPTPTRPQYDVITRTREIDGMVEVYVPASEFLMGSSDSDSDAGSDEKPQHTVYLDDFWIDRTEVTNAQFAAFLNARGNQEEGSVTWLDLEDEDCLIEQSEGDFRPKNGYADHPVVEVSWYGAAAYCQWAGRQLPTEAQWEKVARGTQGLIYPWGNEFDCSRGNFDDETQIDSYVVPGGEGCDGYVRTAPVGSFSIGVSSYGALNMAGNVWEWVADWYDSAYYAKSPSENPPGPSSGGNRVLRGGHWHFSPAYIRAADRLGLAPDYRDDDLGFRCGGVASPGQ